MPILRLPNGQLRDEIRNPVYDSIYIDSAESPIATREFYSAVQGKALYLTNLRQNNLLETAVSFRVQGMGFDCMNNYYANKAALGLIMEHSSLNLKIGEKDYWQGNATFAAGRVKSALAVGDATAGTTTQAAMQHYGDEAVQGVILRGKHVIDINPLQSFRITWACSGMTAAEITASTPAANTRLLFIASLKGLLRRPVQ